MYRQEDRSSSPEEELDGTHAYRLREWPAIPERFRTARVLGACSRMTVGPVTARWFVAQTGLDAARATQLMKQLIAQGAVDRLELGPRGTETPAPALARPSGREQRLPWKHAAAAAFVCLGASAALDAYWPPSLGGIALPTAALISG